MLAVQNITKRFGGIVALNDVSFQVGSGCIYGMIGPNGSGKTTLFNVICGFYRPDSGKVIFEDKEITGLPPHKISKLGIARTFQLVKPFHNLSARDNVALAMYHGREGVDFKVARSRSTELLRFLKLDKKAEIPAKKLTLAERKKLELARALATKPKIILLDEFMAGLNPSEVNDAMSLLRDVQKEHGITLFLVEHVLKAVMTLCDKVVVLHRGVKIAEGSPSEVAQHREVIKAYLGERYIA